MHAKLSSRRVLAIAVEASLFSASASTLAAAATCTVNSNTDDPADASAKVTTVDSSGWAGANKSTISLRDCIVAANLMTGSLGAPAAEGMTIDLSAIPGQTITLGDALPLIFNNTNVDAGAGAPVTVDGAGAHRTR